VIKCQNWILVERFREDREKYEEYVKKINNEKIMFAKAKINDIDLKTLKLIHQLRIVTSSQVAKIIHRGRSHPFKFANNSLKKLFELGCIDRFYPMANGGSSQSHVVLAPIGARLIDVKGYRKVLVLTQNWRHTVYRNNIFADIYEKYKMIGWKPEILLEWMHNGTDKTLRPDAFIGWNNGEKENFAMFEIDMGTEHMNVLYKKIKDYHEYFNTNTFKTDKWQPYEDVAIIPKVIFVFDDEERANTLDKYLTQFETNISFYSFDFNNLIL
jgi:hypothetical protein